MGSTLYVTFLGGFSLAWPDRNGPGLVHEPEHSAGPVWSFLEYLCVHHKEQVSEADLISAILGDNRGVDPSGTLRTLLQRARTIIENLGFPDGGSVLMSRRGVYWWSPGIEFSRDVDDFEALCDDFRDDPDAALPRALEFIPKFGGFLPNAVRRPWVTALRSHYRARYMWLLRCAAALLEDKGRYADAAGFIRRLLAEEPTDDIANIDLMRLLHLSGQTQSALWHYKSLTGLYRERLGKDVPAKITDYFNSVSNEGNTEESELASHKKRLEGCDTLARPLFCDMPAFQTIYHLTARSIPRTGLVAQLALITISARGGAPLTEEQCDAAMESLRSAGLSGLREGDVCTWTGPNSYLLLLSGATGDDAKMTLTRCLTAFEKTPMGQLVNVRTAVTQVEAIET